MSLSRRDAIARLFAVGFASLLPVRVPRPRARKPLPHPDPRPGITAERVIAEDKLQANRTGVRDAYAAARQSPEIFDGLYCVCDCKDSMGHRSLLECFESMQPVGCAACQEESHYAAKLIKDGKTLTEIRAAFDERWG